MEIFETVNYGQFRSIKGNRAVSKKHVTMLMDSITKNNQLDTRPIVVNKNLEIIDGQHRLEAAKNLELPIYYVVKNEADYQEMAFLNSCQANWGTRDFLTMYSNQGFPEYKHLEEFVNRHNINLEPVICFFLYGGGTSRKERLESRSQFLQRFKRGEFVFEGNEELFNSILINFQKLVTIFRERSFKRRKESEFINRSSFVRAFIQFSISNAGIINWDRFFDHLNYKLDSVTPKATTSQYFDLLLNIYNWRLRLGKAAE